MRIVVQSIYRLTRTAGIPFLDVEIDPVRFADDLFFCMRTNNRAIARRLADVEIPDHSLGRLSPTFVVLWGDEIPRAFDQVSP
jgi:hypothetical protein